MTSCTRVSMQQLGRQPEQPEPAQEVLGAVHVTSGYPVGAADRNVDRIRNVRRRLLDRGKGPS